MAPDGLRLEIVEIRDLPLYDQDLETDFPPEPWVDRIRRADAVLFRHLGRSAP
jgi:chromate reductase